MLKNCILSSLRILPPWLHRVAEMLNMLLAHFLTLVTKMVTKVDHGNALLYLIVICYGSWSVKCPWILISSTYYMQKKKNLVQKSTYFLVLDFEFFRILPFVWELGKYIDSSKASSRTKMLLSWFTNNKYMLCKYICIKKMLTHESF